MADIREPHAIPYGDLADGLLEMPQSVVAFLGAGVPLSGRADSAPAAEQPDPADQALADALIAASGMKQPAARALLAWAAHVARELETAGARDETDANALLARLTAAPTAPSAGELAQLFAARAPFDAFKVLGDSVKGRVPERVLPAGCDVADVLRASFASVGMSAPVGSLSSVAALWERGNNRGPLLKALTKTLEAKRTPTRTHRVLARIAARHVARAGASRGDYLIVTTNYDRLMETALDAERVPYLVITTRRADNKVIAVPSADVTDDVLLASLAASKEQFPRAFAPDRSQPIVVLYKMHGSIGRGERDDPLAADSVVISDNDYVECLQWMMRSESMIPALVGDMLLERSFLFLGYSLNDWNVRSVFRGAIEKRTGARAKSFRDYAVLKWFSDFDKTFFLESDVTILHTELGEFASGLLDVLPADYQLAP